jgi:hypothetical protein
MTQYIIVEPLCGLGSRLRAVASAFALCQETQKKLILKWLPREDCDCVFTDLFEVPSEILLYKEEKHSQMKRMYFSSFEDLRASILINDAYTGAHEISTSQGDSQYDEHSFQKFLRLLVPTRKISSIVYGHLKNISECIGLHIRVIDPSIAFDSFTGLSETEIQHLQYYRDVSSVQNFEKVIEYELTKNPLATFFVASNSEKTLAELLYKYGTSRIYCIRHHFHDRSLESIQYSLVDLLLLTKTKVCYGSTWSAFSDVLSYMRKETMSSSLSRFVVSSDFSRVLDRVPQSNAYNLFMFLREFIYQVPINQNACKNETLRENGLLRYLQENKERILQDFSFKSKYEYLVKYDYYREFTLSFTKRLLKIFPQQLSISKFVPSYKLITGKPYDFKYGNHRIGWKAVISNLLNANYVETDDFHFKHPTFEWFSYAMKIGLNTYDEAVSHYMTRYTVRDDSKRLFEPMKVFIVDDWIEFSYNYHLDKKRPYNIKYFSFTHDPLHNLFIEMKNEFSNFLKKKLESPVYYHSEAFQQEKDNLHTLFTLSSNHREQVQEAEIGGSQTKYKMLSHPMEYNEGNTFDYYHFQRSVDKKIYMLGWWMRKYDVFLAMDSSDTTKVIILKDEEGEWVRDYVMFEIRKALQTPGLSNSIVQPRYSEEEAELWYSTLRVNIQDYLTDSEYDKIFQGNLVFLDFYDLSASNAIIECILTSTPLLICNHPACIEYLGEDYPFYFSCLEEASAKVKDMDLICKTHIYLKKMDKKKFTYAYFNECVREALLTE